MSSFIKSKAFLSLAATGSCAAGASTVVYFGANPETPLVQSEQQQPPSLSSDFSWVSENIESSQLVDQNTLTSPVRTVRATPFESVSDNNISISNLKDERRNQEAFETLWTSIETQYKNVQSDQERKRSGLNWKNELKDLLTKDRISGSYDWTININQWKDCRTVGGRDDYCGYLEIEKGGIKYRLKIDRYGKGQPQDWDVTVVRQKDGQVEWYSSEERKWKDAVHPTWGSYQGESNARYSRWSTFSHKSIEIEKNKR